jgi:hypothetical protein
MLIKRPADIPGSEITDKSIYLDRRRFIQAVAGSAIAAAGSLAPAIDADAGFELAYLHVVEEDGAPESGHRFDVGGLHLAFSRDRSTSPSRC